MSPGSYRPVKPIPPALLALVPQPEDNNITVKKSFPDVEADTMPLIVDKTKRTAWQTRKLAAKLKAPTLAATLANDSAFILDYISYKHDAAAHEQVRSPRRLVYDRAGDCDCFAVCIATLLLNQGIKFRFRLAQYPTSGGEWTHIYIVVPKDQSYTGVLSSRSQYYVLDPVTNRHDYEVAFTKKKDVTMSLQFLDGLPRKARELGMLGACTVDQSTSPFTLRRLVDTESVIDAGLVPTQNLLEERGAVYEQHLDPATNNTYFTVFTPAGTVNVATVITKQDAAQLVNMLAGSTTTSSEQQQAQQPQQQANAGTSQVNVQQGSTNWIGYVLAGLSIVASLKPGGAAAVSGIPSKKSNARRKVVPAKRKYQTLTI